jgi:hypothetical protein
MQAAGGLAKWMAGDAVEVEADLEREAWQWLARRDPARLPVYCYFASGDRFVEGQRRMAEALPANAVHEMAGGHEWTDWRRMWTEFLQSGTLR